MNDRDFFYTEKDNATPLRYSLFNISGTIYTQADAAAMVSQLSQIHFQFK